VGALGDWVWSILLAGGGVALTLYGVRERMDPERSVRRAVAAVVGVGGSLALGWGALVDEKLRGTAAGVIVAIVVSGVLFVGANRWFDQAEARWRRFGALTGGVIGFAVTGVLVGNRLLAWKPVPELDLTPWLVPLGTVAGAVCGLVLTGLTERRARLVAGLGFGVGYGVLAGLFIRPDIFPAMKIVPLLAWPVVGALVFGALAAGRRRQVLRAAILGATVGWVIGAWLVPALGTGTRAEAMSGATFLSLGSMLWITSAPPRTAEAQRRLAERSRPVIFLAPALVFIGATLVIPTIRTLYLSFLGPRGEVFVGLANYVDIFTDQEIVKLEKWPQIFTSALFYWGVGLTLLGIVAGRIRGRRTGRTFEPSGGSITPIAVGVFLFVWAVFAYLRGTIFNNLWWVFTVTIVSTAAGLAIAVLADRARYESVAKSMIFMPMAISFVGAGIIWRFMYIARPPTKDQTGVLNAIWVGLGRLSNSGTPRLVTAAVLVAVVAGLVWMAWRGWRGGAGGVVAGAATAILGVVWILYRLLGPGLGGFEIGPNGEVIADTILFIQETPFNNVWLMVVLIWIQTGFTMVIFSAAIKAVPAELIEASKVDGATEAQTFWRVTVPQIAPTIGVVVTTLIVLVMKVFDIVKVMTNGNFDTQVLANEMWQRAFTEFNFGLGSALAVLLFVSVLPIMYLNIRRMQKETVR